MKTLQALIALSLLLSYSCAQKSQLKGATASANIEKPEPDPVPVPDPVPEKEEEQIPADPGIPTKLVGVNFEDNPSAGGDNDFNDAVLCFDGSFLVNGSKVTAQKDQIVKPRFSSKAGCSLKLTAQVKGSSKILTFYNDNAIKYLDKSGTPVTSDVGAELDFKKGDELDVVLEVVSGVCDSSQTYSMSDPARAKVDYDVCNESGR